MVVEAPLAVFDVGNPGMVEHLLRGVVRCWTGRGQQGADEASSLLHALLCELRRQAVLSPGTTDRGLGEARRFIDEHVRERTSVSRLAEIAGLSPRYFTRRFRESFGQTPKHYQVVARMHLARYFLEETSLPVKEIAHELGYVDQYLFSRQYKQVAGMSPTSSRRPG